MLRYKDLTQVMKWLPLPTEGQLNEEGEKYFYLFHIWVTIWGIV